ncbi:MAG: rhodanese-like domain-containing protein, partial [Gemmatimonadota bacterium]|nr:rhodanese-like domain-containing protein [Gemmatimonadota bacterium]
RPHLRHPAALRALYEAAGAATDKVVVAYCRTGVQASHAYFVSRYLGYETRMYDGSFIEWSGTEGNPVER